MFSYINANELFNCRLNPIASLPNAVSLGATDTLKLLLTTTEGKKAKRPHQAFLTLTDPTTGLEESFILSVKDSGKGKVDLVRYLNQLQRTKLTVSGPEGPPHPIPHLVEADPGIHRHRSIRLLYTVQEQGVRPQRVPR